MNGRTINSLLLSLYRLCAFAGQRQAAHGMDSRTLRRGAVLTIHKTDGVRQVEVCSGNVWLTGKSDRDVILRSSDRLDLGAQWPYVIEALSDAEVRLR